MYTRVEVPTYYDREGTDVFLPLLVLKSRWEREAGPYGDGTLLAVAARDGSWRTPRPVVDLCRRGGGPDPLRAGGVLLAGHGRDRPGEWPWEELVAVPEMAAEVMNSERLMFEPTWRDDLGVDGLDRREPEPESAAGPVSGPGAGGGAGEWRAIQDTWLVGRGRATPTLTGRIPSTAAAPPGDRRTDL